MDQQDTVIHRLPPPAAGDNRSWEWPIEVEGDLEWLMSTEKALKFYEKEQDAKFELVGVYPYTFKPLVIIPRIDERCGSWVHLSFLAKPIKETTDDDDDHHVEESKLFFAELVRYNHKEGYIVRHCSILEPNNPGITFSCGICDPKKKIPHFSEYKLGHWPYQNGEIPDSEYDDKCFLEETPGSSKGRQLNLNKLFNGDVPPQYIRMKMKSVDFAELALELDKDKKGQDAEFELVEALGFCRRVIGCPKVQEWVHVNFTAKPKNDCSIESDNVSPKLFFAELFSARLRKYRLVQCSILESNHPGTTYKCRICYPERKIFHPSEYEAGKPCQKVALTYPFFCHMVEMNPISQKMDAAYGAMKPTKDGLEDPHDLIHSENVKNLEKGCAVLVSGAKAKEFESLGTLEVCDPMEEMAHPALKVSPTD